MQAGAGLPVLVQAKRENATKTEASDNNGQFFIETSKKWWQLY
jgi:hypothetical protein